MYCVSDMCCQRCSFEAPTSAAHSPGFSGKTHNAAVSWPAFDNICACLTGCSQYLGAFVTEEAAREALAQAALDRQQASAAMAADAGNIPAGSAGDPAPIPTGVWAAAAAAAAALGSSE
jgi:hypothetical protein